MLNSLSSDASNYSQNLTYTGAGQLNIGSEKFKKLKNEK